jgi:hypothetical protein
MSSNQDPLTKTAIANLNIVYSQIATGIQAVPTQTAFLQTVGSMVATPILIAISSSSTVGEYESSTQTIRNENTVQISYKFANVSDPFNAYFWFQNQQWVGAFDPPGSQTHLISFSVTSTNPNNVTGITPQ